VFLGCFWRKKFTKYGAAVVLECSRLLWYGYVLSRDEMGEEMHVL